MTTAPRDLPLHGGRDYFASDDYEKRHNALIAELARRPVSLMEAAKLLAPTTRRARRFDERLAARDGRRQLGEALK